MKDRRKTKRRPVKHTLLMMHVRRLRAFAGICSMALPLFGTLAVFTLESYGRQYGRQHETR